MVQPQFEPVERSVYIGRRRLGRFVQIGQMEFEAFDAADRRLGYFQCAAQALAAIGDGSSSNDLARSS